MSNFSDISSLATLIKESQEKDSSNEIGRNSQNQPPTSLGKINIIPRNTISNSNNSGSIKTIEHKPSKNEKDIWDVDELPDEESIVNIQDNRPSPRYEISYKQIVGSEDIFLGMSDKSPSSSDCTHLVVKIHFPNSSMKELDLDVTTNRIKAESKTHRLFTYLPVTVDSNNGKAKYDPKKEVLTVVLPIVREF